MINLLRYVQAGSRNLYQATWLQHDDVWMPSFPRAGSTWVRYILANIIALQEANGREIDFNDVRHWLPAFGSEFFTKNYPYHSVPRIVKTHRRCIPLLFSKPRHCVYLIRDPRSIMASYYRFVLQATRHSFKGTFSEFIRHPNYGLPAFLHHYESWAGQTDILLRYEDLKRDTTGTLLKLFNGLGWPISESVAAEAVERSSLSRMKKTEEWKGLPNASMYAKGFRAVNTGETGSWIDSFSEADLAYYRQICRERTFQLYQRAVQNSAPK